MSNPTGKGGFKDHPESIHPNVDYWSQMKTILQRIGNLSPDEFTNYQPISMKEKMVYEMLKKNDYKEVFDRLDGKAKQTIEQMGNINNTLTFQEVAVKKKNE